MCEQRLDTPTKAPQQQDARATAAVPPPQTARTTQVPDAVVDAAAGVVGSVCSLLATYPLKTLYQYQALAAGGKDGKALGVLDVLQRYKLSGLYIGIEPNIVETALSSGVYFYLYRKLKDLATEQGRKELGLVASLLVPAVAGVGNQLITMPASVIATRMQAMKKVRVDARLSGGSVASTGNTCPAAKAPPPVTVGSVTRAIFDESGPGGFWAGLLPSLVLISNPTIQYMLYEQLLRALRAWKRRRMLAQWQEQQQQQQQEHEQEQEQEQEQQLADGVQGGKEGHAAPNGFHQAATPAPAAAGSGRADAATSTSARQQRLQAPPTFDVKFAAWETFLVSALSKIGATVATYWILIVKTRMQAQGKETPPELQYKGTWDALVRIFRAEGLAGFTKGLGAKVVQTALNAALMLMLKEQVYMATRSVLTNPSVLWRTQTALLKL